MTDPGRSHLDSETLNVTRSSGPCVLSCSLKTTFSLKFDDFTHGPEGRVTAQVTANAIALMTDRLGPL
jgi:hypothetical protein